MSQLEYLVKAVAPMCASDNNTATKTIDVSDANSFSELISSARAGCYSDVVSELLSGRRDGGPRILSAAVEALDAVRIDAPVSSSIIAGGLLRKQQLDGPRVTVAIAGEVARALSARDEQVAMHAFELASACAKRGDEQRVALIDSGAIQCILSTLAYFKEDASLQFVGLAALSDVIYTHVEGLRNFVREHGFQHVEDIMQRFPEDAKLQRRAIAMLSSAAKWPDNFEMKREFDFQPFRAIALTKQAMLMHAGDADLQLKGMEAMSAIVGTSFEDLYQLASGGGLEIYERAMLRFPENAAIQEKVFKTFAGAVKWPEDACRRTGYNAERGLAFMKQGMWLHLENEKLQRIATDKLKNDFLPAYAEEIARCGGGDLLRAVMIQHQRAEDICSNCRSILKALGEPVPDLSYRVDVQGDSGSSKSGMLELSSLAPV